MLQVHDLRQTRIYQELREELSAKLREECLREGTEKGIEKGIEEERQRNLQEKLRSISKMAALKMSADTIADLLGLGVDLVRKEMAKNPS
jgi:predicted transposase YdaD